MIKSITELTEKELRGRRVLLRVDFNVAVKGGEILETHRIKANKETIDFLIKRGAIVGLISHITAVNSFEKIYGKIGKILGYKLKFLNDCVGSDVYDNLANGKSGDIFLLQNVRKHEGEEKNDNGFAKELAEPFIIYVNNAFSASHRNHASIAAITKFLPSYAGLLTIKEVLNLDKVLKLPKKNKTLIIGGAKIESKLPVIENLLSKFENILIGGAVANVFLKTRKIDIKKSLTDDEFLAKAKKLLNDPKIVIPSDYVFSKNMILDIGPKTISKFCGIIKKSGSIVWDGPLGKAEISKLSRGTKEIAMAVADSDAFKVIGGGDTIAFLEKINLIDRFDYISTGGGAMLEFLAGDKLPGLEALGYYGD